MFREAVKVIDVFGDKAVIGFRRSPMCSHCQAKTLCHDGRDSMVVDTAGFSLKKGDRIEIAISERKTFLAGMIAFFMPAVIFIWFLIVFKQRGEFFSFSIASGALIIYYLAVREIMKHKGRYFNINILRKI